MIEAVSQMVFASWYNAFTAIFLFFSFLYWGFTLAALAIFNYFESKAKIVKVDNHYLYPGQVQKEIAQSMRSILIFSLQGILIQQGIVNGWFHIHPSLNWWVLPQILTLFLWNEVHFYFCHMLLHTRFMMKHVHRVHHYSKEPTLFSTFSFHWLEAFLLGTVIFLPLLVYPVQLLALISLPVMSLLINLLGHSNYDLFARLDQYNKKKYTLHFYKLNIFVT